MSLKKIFLKTKLSYRVYLYYNLYIRHKGFLNRKQFSQWGEDQEIKKFFLEKKKGVYLDIGCFHPYMYSNTALLHKKGWRGVNVDMNPTSIDLFNIARPNDINICSAVSDEIKDFEMYYDDPFSPVNTIDKEFYKMSKHIFFKKMKTIIIKSKKFKEIIKISKIEEKIDFINIDVEGFDYEVLKQIHFEKFKVKLIAIETHHVDGSETKNNLLINEFLKKFNFTLHKRVGPTSLFVNKQ